MRVAAGGIRLPDLDDRIRHRRPVAIEDAPLDDDALSLRVAARQVIPFRAVEPERKKRPDRLRRRRDQLRGHDAPHAGSSGVACRPRNTMSQR